MKKGINIVSIITAIAGFIFILYLAIMPTAMNRSFFYKIYERSDFNVYQKDDYSLNKDVYLPKEEVKKALDHTLKYMLAEVESLQIQITFSDGSVENFYTASELSHMEDCQKLFVGGRNIAWSCFAIMILGIGYLTYIRKEIKSKHINNFFIGFGSIVAIVALIGIYAAIDFDNAFTIFHKIFFPQGNWSFYYNSYMIQMLPQDLVFQTIAYNMIIKFLIYMVVAIGGLIFLKKYLQRKESLKILESK